MSSAVDVVSSKRMKNSSKAAAAAASAAGLRKHNIKSSPSSSSAFSSSSDAVEFYTDKHNVGFHYKINESSDEYKKLKEQGQHVPNFHCKLHHQRCKAALTKAKNSRCANSATETIPYCKVHLPIYMHLETKTSSIPKSGKGLFAKLPLQLVKKLEQHQIVSPGERIVVFRPGDLIARYIGEYLTEHELDQRYGDFVAPYAIQLNALRNLYRDDDDGSDSGFRRSERMKRELKNFIDAACVRGIAAAANDSANPKDINAEFLEYTHHGKELIKEKEKQSSRKNKKASSSATAAADYYTFESSQIGTDAGQLHPKHVNIGLFASKIIYNGDEIFVSYGDEYWTEKDAATTQKRIVNYSSTRFDPRTGKVRLEHDGRKKRI